MTVAAALDLFGAPRRARCATRQSTEAMAQPATLIAKTGIPERAPADLIDNRPNQGLGDCFQHVD